MNESFKELTFSPKTYVVWKNEVEISKIMDPSMWQTATNKVLSYIQRQNLKLAGKMSALYLSWDEAAGKTVLAIGFSVEGVSQINDAELSLVSTPESKAVMAEGHGAYDNLRNVHDALKNNLAEKGVHWTMAIEEYVVTGMDNPDSHNWLTNIFYLYE